MLLLNTVAMLNTDVKGRIQYSCKKGVVSPYLRAFMMTLPTSNGKILSLMHLLTRPVRSRVHKRMSRDVTYCHHRGTGCSALNGRHKGARAPMVPLGGVFLVSNGGAKANVLRGLVSSSNAKLVYRDRTSAVSATVNSRCKR